MIFILSDTYEKARWCALAHGFEDDDERVEWEYVYDPSQLEKIDSNKATIWRYNAWWAHPYAEKIWEKISRLGIRVHDKVEKFRDDYNLHAEAHAVQIMR